MEKSIPDASGHRSRLRARFLKTGFQGFCDYESLELLLTLCIPRRDVKQTAKSLIARFGNLKGVFDAPRADLLQVPGIGEVAATAFSIIKESSALYLLQSAEKRSVLDSSDKLEAFWQSRLSSLRHEVFEVAYLDNQYQLLPGGVERLEVGTVDHTVVYPRKVIESALKHAAAAIVLAHNHPAGTATPSKDDHILTKALEQAAAPLNITVIDHIIVAGKEIYSYRRAGLIVSR